MAASQQMSSATGGCRVREGPAALGMGVGTVSISPDTKHRQRFLVVIPIAAVLVTLLLVSACFCESPGR